MPHFKKTALAGLRAALLLVALAAIGLDGGVLSTPGAYAQSAAIREIRVVGNRRIEPETVRSYLQFSVGEAYDAGKVDRSLRALFGTGLFSDVRIDREGSAVVVTVAENPVIAQVAFEGNGEVDTASLQSEVQLKPRTVYTRARALADVQRILDVYRRQGRYAASVEPKLIELEQNRVNVVFEISEGKATKVKAINFVGNRAFTDGQLRDIISTTESGWFDFLKGTNVYDPDRMNLDRELLRQYYIKNGYADARVVAANADLDRDGSGFFLTYTVEEGQLYRFGTITIDNKIPAVKGDGLYSELTTKSGDLFNGTEIDKSSERVTIAVSEQGFAFVRVRADVDRDAASRTINIRYVIEEGPRIYIDRINIAGNVRTRDYVIRREFRLAEGDAYNPLMVDKAKKRLEALGFFKKVEVNRRPGSADDRVVLDVVVQEQPTGELSFGAGFSTTEGVIGDITFTERNLMGNGQFLRLKVSGSTTRFQLDMSFTEPRFLDTNIAAGFDLFFKDVNQLSTSSFSSRVEGGAIRFGFPLAENLWLNTNYTLQNNDIYEVDTTTASLAVLQAQGSYITSSVGAGLVYDNRNHPKNPTRGTYFEVTSDFAGVGGDAQYVRVQGEARAYYPIMNQVTLVGRAIGGTIEGWGGQDVRLLDLFYKGGETIRGFARSGIGPRDTVTGNALGGRNYWAATAEVRYPLPFVPDELGMQGAVFADAGSLWDTGNYAKSVNNQCGSAAPDRTQGICLMDSAAIRSSVGASIIWNSPVGPLRFDYAFPLTKESYDATQQFRFGASTKF